MTLKIEIEERQLKASNMRIKKQIGEKRVIVRYW